MEIRETGAHNAASWLLIWSGFLLVLFFGSEPFPSVLAVVGLVAMIVGLLCLLLSHE